MRCLSPLAFLAFLALVAACENDPYAPEFGIDPVDTTQTHGTLLATNVVLNYREPLVWIPGTELIAFFSPTQSVAGCAIWTVDVGTGETTIVDVGCAPQEGFPYVRQLVAAPNGSALYYSVWIDAPRSLELELRAADPAGGDVTTLRAGRAWALAVSPDGQHLAYQIQDSVLVRDMDSGIEYHYPVLGAARPINPRLGAARPITFSPDGAELLYEVRDPVSLSRTLRRLSLEDGTSKIVPLPQAITRHFHWGASGVMVLAEVVHEHQSEYSVFNLTTGESVQVASVPRGERVPYTQFHWGRETWSMDGTRVAYWTGTCHEWADFLNCSIQRRALFVADTRSGARARVVYTSRDSSPVVFSPDGTRLAYFSSESVVSPGDFYVVDVP